MKHIRFIGSAAYTLTAICAMAQAPVPEFYGYYAVQGGKLADMYEDPAKNDYEQNIQFVVFTQSPPQIKLFFIPPAKKNANSNNEFKGWDDFMKQSQDFQQAMALALDFGKKKEVEHLYLASGIPGLTQPTAQSRVRGPESATGSSTPSGPSSPSVNAPKPAGKGRNVTFAIRNKTSDRIEVFLDNAPITLQAGKRSSTRLEVGTKHMVRTVVNGKTLRKAFVTPDVSLFPGFSVQITENGIELH
jgi:hypothetical protein